MSRESLVLLVNSGFSRPINGVTTAWFVPGGGVQPGEPVTAAAVREIHEETGFEIQPADLLHLAYAEGIGQVGDLHGPMRDDFFLCGAPDGEPSTTGLEEHERRVFDSYRWWSIDDLQRTEDVVFPRHLATTLTAFGAASSWSQPERLPW